ncbi:MAG: hypothetical protein GY847_01035 [Proteobacteria bacterium]|nr:hypothetical protein [Pseudomonadota bacterium]
MKVPPRHLFQQGPMLKTLAKTIASALPLGPLNAKPEDRASLRRVYKETVSPRSPDIIRDYIRHVGGDPSWYRGVLPAHMFHQWGFPLMASTLQSLPYNLIRTLNGGCRFEVYHDIPADVPLILSAKLQDIKDDGKKAVLTQRLVTGTPEHAKALVSYVTAIVPLTDSKGSGKDDEKSGKDEKKKERPKVPLNARQIDRLHLVPRCGLEFGFVTGDVNPIHWIGPYARLSGFKNPILHGFSGMARLVESLNRTIWSGNVNILQTFEARFVKPLVLPATVGVYIDDSGGIYMGKAPGGPAYLSGAYTVK